MAAIGLIAGGTLLLRDRRPPVAPPAPAVAASSPIVQHPESQPDAPVVKTSGRIIWTGQARRGALLRFEGGSASAGSVYGRFPGGPIEVRVFPAERAPHRFTVFTSDERYATPVRAATAAGPALFSWDPRHITDLTLWERPGPANNWRRCMLRVNSGRLTACVIEWKRI